MRSCSPASESVSKCDSRVSARMLSNGYSVNQFALWFFVTDINVGKGAHCDCFCFKTMLLCIIMSTQ